MASPTDADPAGDGPSADIVAVAAEVLRGYGVEFADVRENRGHTNASWTGVGLVIKVAPVGAVPPWSREVALAEILPPQVGYPTVLGHGVTDGHEWLVTKLIEADNLEGVWPGLSSAQRVHALRQCWALIRAVHATEPAGLAPAESRCYPLSPEPVRKGLAELHALGFVSGDDLPVLNAMLDRHWQARRTAANVLNHGDFWTCNALWDGIDVVSLLDFELAIVAPPHVDLNELVKFAYAPPETPDSETGDEAQRMAVAELAAPLLRTPADIDLLLGYSVQLEVWVALAQLARPWHDLPAAELQCFHMLSALAAGSGGYYAPLFDRLGVTDRVGVA